MLGRRSTKARAASLVRPASAISVCASTEACSILTIACRSRLSICAVAARRSSSRRSLTELWYPRCCQRRSRLWRKLLRDAEISAALRDALLRLRYLALSFLGRRRPDGVIVERVLCRHLVLEIGEQITGALFGGRLLDLLALPNQALQVLALRLGHRAHAADLDSAMRSSSQVSISDSSHAMVCGPT